MSDTYGVGPAAVKKNVSATDSKVTVLNDEGVAKQGSTVVFDPAIDPIELQVADGAVPGDPGVEPNAAPEPEVTP